jgi:2-C-methyl-D-erythritol 4-phosphate cytidylyltransferase
MNIALIIAGGKGGRTKQDIPKQFLHIDNKPIIIYTLEAFQQHPSIDEIFVVCLAGWLDILWAYIKQFNIEKVRKIVPGGLTGHDSIHNGLMELKESHSNNDAIIIHDANRPLVSQDIISDGLSTFKQYGSSVTAIPCTEVVFRSSNGNTPDDEVPRQLLWRTQTPQIFSMEKLIWAHDEVIRRKLSPPTATCSLMQTLDETFYFSSGSEKNIKITTIDDIDMVRALLKLSEYSGLKK